jgi:hypothetical protein
MNTIIIIRGNIHRYNSELLPFHNMPSEIRYNPEPTAHTSKIVHNILNITPSIKERTVSRRVIKSVRGE